MRRSLALTAVGAIVASLSLAACQGSTPEPGGGPTSGSDTTASDDAATEPEGGSGATGPFSIAVRKGDNNVVPTLVDAWNAANPNAQATLELLDGNADQQRQQFSLELDAASDEFDVIGLDVTWTGEFAKNGWIESGGGLSADVSEAIFPGPVSGATYNGDLYAVPLLVGVGLLYYRTDLVDVPAATWQELSAQAREVAEAAGIDPFVAQGASYEGMVCNYLELLWSAGGDLFDDDYTKATLTDGDAALKALEFMKESYEDGFYAPGFTTMTEAEARPAFEDGGAVFMRHWIAPFIPMSTSTESAVVGQFDIQPLPTFDGNKSVSALGGLNLAVNAYSANKESATAFIEWATMSDAAAQILVDAGIAPASKAAYTSENLEGNAFMQALSEILPTAKARPALPEWGTISSVMSRELFEAYTGQKDPQEALDTIQTALEDAID